MAAIYPSHPVFLIQITYMVSNIPSTNSFFQIDLLDG